jgi:Regulator of chromosome condensation (RCC1) repeat
VENSVSFFFGKRWHLTAVGAALMLAWCVSGAHGATTVDAWGAGTFISNPSDYYNWGQSIVPAGLTNAALVAGGWRHSLALNADGTLTAWGDDLVGQTDFFPSSDYLSISCGWQHSLALLTNGIVVAAGDDTYGQTEVPVGLSNVVAVACGFYHSLALKSDGTVVAWGPSTNIASIGIDPDYGQTLVPAGLSNVVAIAGGGWHSLALLSDGTIRAWGRADSGQIFIPSVVSNVVAISGGAIYSLALEANGTVVAWGDGYYDETNVPGGLSNVVAIAAGGWHGLALKSDGTMVGWGASGTNASTSNIGWGQNIVPAGLTNVVQIAAGAAHSLALVGNALPVTQAAMINPSFGTNGFSVLLPTRNGRVYRLEYKNSLSGANWTALPLQAGTGHLQQFTDPGASAGGSRFYRIRRW